MDISLDQARALDALARCGTFAAAAKQLHKGHTAVLYAIDALEQQTELVLLDRRGYRTKLSPAGERVLEQCRKLLQTERELVVVCQELKSGWEPSLSVVFDGVYPAAPILGVMSLLNTARAPTRLKATVEFLSGVETVFLNESADVMISVLSPQTRGLRSIKLPKIQARLVAQRKHPLAGREGTLNAEALEGHVYITVRGSDPRLDLSTANLEQRSSVYLNDFSAKKVAIMQGIGFGWLPEHLIDKELRRGELVELRFEQGSRHTFEPRLYTREGQRLGRAATQLVEALSRR